MKYDWRPAWKMLTIYKVSMQTVVSTLPESVQTMDVYNTNVQIFFNVQTIELKLY